MTCLPDGKGAIYTSFRCIDRSFYSVLFNSPEYYALPESQVTNKCCLLLRFLCNLINKEDLDEGNNLKHEDKEYQESTGCSQRLDTVNTLGTATEGISFSV